MQPIQRKDPFPYGDALCVDLEDVCVFRQTSGTTGSRSINPIPGKIGSGGPTVGQRCCGHKVIGRQIRSFFHSATMYSSHFGPHTTLRRKIGCETVPGGVLDTKSRILKIQELQATALMATPT